MEQFEHLRVGRFEARTPRGIDELGEIVFGEIDGGLHSTERVDELVLDRVDALRECAAGGGMCGLQGSLCAAADLIDHRLGLHEIDAAMKEGALGELAGPRESRAATKHFFEDRVE